MDELTDEELFQLFQDGCDKFREGYEAIGVLLYRHREYLSRIIEPQNDSKQRVRTATSDIVAATHLQVLEYLKRNTSLFLEKVSSQDFKAWLKKVCKNHFLKEIRASHTRMRNIDQEQQLPSGFDLPTSSQTPSSLIQEQERDAAVNCAINSLEEADRILIRLNLCHGMSAQELVELLDPPCQGEKRKEMEQRLGRIKSDLLAFLALQDAMKSSQ